METVQLTLPSNTDLTERITQGLEGKNLSSACVLAAAGNLSSVVLRFAGSEEERTIPGPLQMLSLTGIVSRSELNLSVMVADRTGAIYGGRLAGGNTAETPVVIVITALSPVESAAPQKPATVAKAVSSPSSATNSAKGNSYILHTDGASKGNPGPSGIGIALFKAEDMEKPVAVLSDYIGETTNNVAEYQALIRGLKEALLRGVERVEVRTDSQLMAQQVNGRYKVNAPQILPLHTEARQLMARFASVRVNYVPREQNSLADKLANQGVAQGR